MSEADRPISFWGAACFAVVVAGVAACSAAGTALNSQMPQAGRAPEIKDAIARRFRYKVPTPEAEPEIYVDSIAVHHFRDEAGTVATRAADGRWHVSSVVEEGPALLKVEQRLVSNETRTLSDADGHKLDDLLKQAGLYHQSSDLDDDAGVGAIYHTMEIDTPAGHTVIRWTGRLHGKAGAVADLIIGAA